MNNKKVIKIEFENGETLEIDNKVLFELLLPKIDKLFKKFGEHEATGYILSICIQYVISIKDEDFLEVIFYADKIASEVIDAYEYYKSINEELNK